MAKVILEFDTVEDREAMETAVNAWKWKMLAWDLDDFLRSELKYNDSLSGEAHEAVQRVRDRLHELKNENGLILE